MPGEITHDVSGYVIIGNGSPVTIDVDSLVVSGATDGMTTIQVLDAAGQTSGLYYWYNEFTEGATTYPAGWFDVSGLVEAGIELAPGAGVLFNSAEMGVKVTIPSAL